MVFPRLRCFAAALGLVTPLAFAGEAQSPPRGMPPPVPFPEVRTITLSNGMHFLLVRRAEAPTFRGIVAFRIGGVDDEAGATGMAHMFEHMAFKGTRAIGTKDWAREKPLLDRIEKLGAELSALRAKGGDPTAIAGLRKRLEELDIEHRKFANQNEFDQIYSEAGKAGLNASTSQDWTRYYISLPANRLELWMLMESERLRDPVFREFYKERDVVAEERPMRT